MRRHARGVKRAFRSMSVLPASLGFEVLVSVTLIGAGSRAVGVPGGALARRLRRTPTRFGRSMAYGTYRAAPRQYRAGRHW